MNSKTDKEDRSCDDIACLSEIIIDFRFWQAICNLEIKIFAVRFLKGNNFSVV